ncbi:MAG: hypothetical protein ACJATN_001037 [Neolewinella sp.]|jgi:hypothetical protein
MRKFLLTSLALVFISLFVNAQDAPKKSNLILLSTSDNIDDSFKKMGRLLINAGYEFETANKDFYLITTKVRQQKYGFGGMGSLEMKLTVEFNEVSDSTHFTIRGLVTSGQLARAAGNTKNRFDKNAYRIENKGAKGSILKSAWIFMGDLAKKYENSKIDYSQEDEK